MGHFSSLSHIILFLTYIIFTLHYSMLYFFYLYYTIFLYFYIFDILILVFHEYHRDVFHVFSFHPSRLPACLSSVYLSLRAVFNKVTQCVRATAKWENRARSVIQCLSLWM